MVLPRKHCRIDARDGVAPTDRAGTRSRKLVRRQILPALRLLDTSREPRQQAARDPAAASREGWALREPFGNGLEYARLVRANAGNR
jgi:hypothetical protein